MALVLERGASGLRAPHKVTRSGAGLRLGTMGLCGCWRSCCIPRALGNLHNTSLVSPREICHSSPWDEGEKPQVVWRHLQTLRAPVGPPRHPTPCLHPAAGDKSWRL